MASTRGISLAEFTGHDRAVFGIDGLYCPSCARAVERALADTPGVQRARVSYASASAAVSWAPGTDLDELADRVARLGFSLAPRIPHRERLDRIEAEIRQFGIRLAIGVVFGAWTMAFALVTYLDPHLSFVTHRALGSAMAATSLPVILIAGAPMLLSGWRTFRAGAPGMDTLVSLGSISAAFASCMSLALGHAEVWFDTAVMLTTLLLTARVIEMVSLRRAAAAIATVEADLPERALRRGPDGNWQEVLATEVECGDRIRLPAGERLTLDGVIAAGASAFDTSTLTGEAMRQEFGSGGRVLAGFVNLSSAVEIDVAEAVGARRIDKIGTAIESLRHDRLELHALADRLAGIIAPAALILSAVAAIAGLLFGLDREDTALRALSVLVIACPCAVALAAPLTHLAAQSAASRHAIYLRGPTAAESLGNVRTLVFDKTGTLTEGQPRVVEVHSNTPREGTEALALAGVAQSDLHHPLATALRRATDGDMRAALSERFPNGVRAQIGETQVMAGSAQFLSEAGVAVPSSKVEPGSHTEVHVAKNGRHLAVIRLADTLRLDAAPTVAALMRQGIDVHIATGDRRASAMEMAERVGIPSDRVHHDLSPLGKADLARRLPGPVAFIGDGVNDSVALVAADVGIAATDAASATVGVADIVLARGGLAALGRARGIALSTRRILRQNLGFAVCYNAVALPLAIQGTIPPVVAAAAMALSSVTVILNALRLEPDLRCLVHNSISNKSDMVRAKIDDEARTTG